mgnify:CR=1 FL=1
MTMIGVTGTKGKTTTVCMIRKILEDFGIRTGMIGTVGQFDGVRKEQAEHTTPDAVTLQRLLGRMRQNGCRVCVMEVSSQALKLKRTCGICFDLGVFLNLGEDHIGKLEHASRRNIWRVRGNCFFRAGKVWETGMIRPQSGSFRVRGARMGRLASGRERSGRNTFRPRDSCRASGGRV